MLDGATTAGLEAEANTVEADLEAADRQFMEATEARLAAGQDLSRVTGDADIAVLTERKATLELELEEAALEHLELSLGHGLAEEATRRYRDIHRSGMMAATERAFAALTRDAYPRIATRPDGADETLLAFDAHGAAKRVADMSKGTRFQLYLALRAAAYAQMVEQGVCLPFFCDDIFETFDEDRTSSACQIMEQIGRNGQAIYLTHHRHVVDIARQVCKTAPVVHEIRGTTNVEKASSGLFNANRNIIRKQSLARQQENFCIGWCHATIPVSKWRNTANSKPALLHI